jgi:hypothetical protein
MIEVLAAVAGASISVAAMGARRFQVNATTKPATAVIRLTIFAVEHIALQLEVMHTDIKDDKPRNLQAALIEVEQRVSKLEAHPHQ